MDEIKKHVWPNLRSPGDKAAEALLNTYGAYDDALLDALEHGTGFMSISADGVKHVPRSDVIDTQPPAVAFPDADLESIDRASITVWLIRCIDNAPEGLHSAVARDIVSSTVKRMQADIESINNVPNESTISRW